MRDLHADQTDKAGEPYIGHVLRVYQNLLDRFPAASEDAQHSALLHDAIEDCDVTPDDLHARGYSEITIKIVQAVTKGCLVMALTYADRIERLAQTGLVEALQVKISDLIDNNDPARLAALPDAKAASLSKRYSAALECLTSALDRITVPDRTGL